MSRPLQDELRFDRDEPIRTASPKRVFAEDGSLLIVGPRRSCFPDLTADTYAPILIH